MDQTADPIVSSSTFLAPTYFQPEPQSLKRDRSQPPTHPSAASKLLGGPDVSGAKFVQRALAGDSTFGINLDRVQFDSQTGQYVIIELLKAEDRPDVTPWTSHPNRYFHKNALKFVSLFKLATRLNARLYLVNYAEEGTAHDNEVLLMEVIEVKRSSASCPVKTRDTRMTFSEYSAWFRDMNKRGQDAEPVIWLDVKYEQRELAKMLGARWDADRRRWYMFPDNPALDAIGLIKSAKVPPC